MAKTWGVPGKRQTYLSPGEQIAKMPKVPLNANPLNAWDYKKSKYRRIDLFPKAVSENTQQGGVIPVTSGVVPVVTPTSTPSVSNTPTPTPTSTTTPTLTSTLTSTPTPTSTTTPTPTPSASVWTPANFTGLWDWWSSDYGVNVINTDDVDQWTGHSGNVLLPFNTGAYPKIINSDSDFNNQPSIELNSVQAAADVGMSVDNNTNTTDKTLLVVGYVDSWVGFDSMLLAINPGAAPRMGIWASNTQYLTYFNDGLGDNVVYAGTSPTAPVYQFVKISYNRSTGDYIYGASTTNDFNTNIETRTGQTGADYIGAKFALCNYGGAYGITPNFRVVEYIAIDGIPSSTEYNNFEAYLTSKYGL
jgi:hypothetical protein